LRPSSGLFTASAAALALRCLGEENLVVIAFERPSSLKSMSMVSLAQPSVWRRHRCDVSRLDPCGKDSNHIVLYVIWDGGKVSGSE
jgi:hypothetical protein